MMHPYPIAVVEWDDAVNHGDVTGEPIHAPVKQVTVGWLVRRDKAGVTLAMEYNANEPSWRREESFLPAGMVTKVTVHGRSTKGK